MNKIKKILVLPAVLLTILVIYPVSLYAADLAPGDIAIIGINSDDPDGFSFVSLNDIGQGTVIKFTDNGVYADGSFRSTEGICTWTAADDVSSGEIRTYTSPGGGEFSPAGSFLLAAAGDQVIAYQGDEASPSFIYAVQTNSTQWQADASSAQTSALPPGLTEGETAVAVGRDSGPTDEWDNAVYDMSVTSGNKDEILASIGNADNWDGSNNPVELPPEGSFKIEENKAAASPGPVAWIRTMPMTCRQVWVNEDNNFQFIFWYPYKDKNYIRIYDMEANMVFEVDLPRHDPNFIVDLPDGFYIVRTYHDQDMLQEFLIGKP